MISLVKLFSTLCLHVEWDDMVRNNLKQEYQNSSQAQVPICLLDFLTGLGSAQPRRIKSTRISSILDYGYLLERIYDSPELRIKIDETRTLLGSETLTEMSELMGVGLSVAVVSHLFDIQRSTVHKVVGENSQRPDWRCLLKDNRTLLVESKGSTSRSTSTSQMRKAVGQKNAIPGDVNIAMATLLNENVASKMNVKDPPVINENDRSDNKRHVYRALHYSSLFSFLGDDVLSLYFEKMSKRLSGEIRKEEMYDKQHMFNELKYNAPNIHINDENYAGHLYGPVEDRYMFLGVDKKLLSYRGFIDYQDADNDQTVELSGNTFTIHSDGIVIGNVIRAEKFLRDNPMVSIGLSEDSIALSDLDSIRGNTFKRYVKYLLSKCDDNLRWDEDGSLKANINGQERIYFCYHVYNTKEKYASWRMIEKVNQFMNGRHGVLVTNLRIRHAVLDYPCVCRDEFAIIAKNNARREIVEGIFGII